MTDRPGLTPSQTVGPFLSLGLPWPDGPDVVPDDTPGAIHIGGIVFDGAGEPVFDAVVETWQADPAGHFDHPESSSRTGFRGFGRCPTDGDGHWEIRTLKPGPVDGQAPHVDVSVFARGLLDRVVTRIYFPDETAANAADPVLAAVPAARRATLVAVDHGRGDLRFDIRLQGDGETVFFTV
ncbi:protocatechuate 3,4-dioxygenase subunit alpha [Pseudonocardia sp. N23]|uniref:protocatechuate 3,4-dioxygenase subunit alpha n=1 Tax=Pseudonocardia sp. N23 TaxID=1987376 RepID=UPI000BFB596E|nr:protocatechuate 3,4-dioxygenase subunit alpha [Pseudonocardia sp. N23]GAY08226.1 protocatechuate 3,4-dioxygenase alpha chain [Pseudonocardia sp. N23]